MSILAERKDMDITEKHAESIVRLANQPLQVVGHVMRSRRNRLNIMFVENFPRFLVDREKRLVYEAEIAFEMAQNER